MTNEKFEWPEYYNYYKTKSKQEKKVRNCMMCNKPFKSQAKFNRICWPCKNSDDWRYGNDYNIMSQ